LTHHLLALMLYGVKRFCGTPRRRGMQQNTSTVVSHGAERLNAFGTGHSRSVLRARTRDLHLHAEDALGADSWETLVGYVGMLQSNLSATVAVHGATEPHLPPAMREGLAVDARRLREDLAELDARPYGQEAHLELDEPAGAIGALYVLEGARLGGKLLARKVEAHLGLTAEHGATYLNGDGADTGRRWRQFLVALEDRLVSSDDRARAVAAARATFRLVIRQYEKMPG
jgi:heme oxygenase